MEGKKRFLTTLISFVDSAPNGELSSHLSNCDCFPPAPHLHCERGAEHLNNAKQSQLGVFQLRNFNSSSDGCDNANGALATQAISLFASDASVIKLLQATRSDDDRRQPTTSTEICQQMFHVISR